MSIEKTSLEQAARAAFAAAALSLAASWAPPAGAEKELLWGDTHVHTFYSPDSFINQNFSLGPAAAYRFAKGLPVAHPLTGTRVQIQTPLDFLVVSDHAESMGVFKAANGEGLPRDGLGPIDRVQSWAMEQIFQYIASDPSSLVDLLGYAAAPTLDVLEAAAQPAAIGVPNQERVQLDAWRESTLATDAANDPGRFTALIGWEWSSTPAGANLHRVVFMNGDAEAAAQFAPFSSSTSNYPEDLWAWLDQTAAATGADFVAIPHNSNISRGFMFPRDRRLRDTPIDRDWIDRRAKWETVVEATQVKGDSETDPAVSPDDSFADFEAYPHYISPQAIPWDPGQGDFVRSALLRGLALESDFGANPYRFGVIGSTDSHTGLATAEEPNFWGKFLTDSTMDGKTRTTNRIENFGWAMSASGLAAVWAEENTRDAILAAFKRREVYATTGPRIGLRVTATNGDGPSPVPMGGMLSASSTPPTLAIEATRDPLSAGLDRIQVVKGWIDGDGTHERVVDVVWHGDRSTDADGIVSALPGGFDPVTGEFDRTIGAASLTAEWQDPDFDPAQSAFYYVRVLEMPSPRHSTLDAIALDRDPATTGHPVTIQERAYSSPIHYQP